MGILKYYIRNDKIILVASCEKGGLFIYEFDPVTKSYPEIKGFK